MKKLSLFFLLALASVASQAQTYTYTAPYSCGTAYLSQPMVESCSGAVGADGKTVTDAITMDKVSLTIGSVAALKQIQLTREYLLDGVWVYDINQLVFVTGTIMTELLTKDAAGHAVYNFHAVGTGGFYLPDNSYHTVSFDQQLSWVYLGVGRSAGYRWQADSGFVTIN